MRNFTVLWLLLGCLGAVLAAPGLTPDRAASAAEPSTLDRPFDPVVLSGADVPSLAGLGPDEIVGFKYDGGWQQIPVQVDERAIKDFAEVYNVGGGSGAERGQAAGQAYPVPTGVTELVYIDSGTFTGPDPDGTFDDDDEIAFMAKDAGGQASSVPEPPGVVPGSSVEIALSDPLDVGVTGYVYLFRSDGSLTPGAGQEYVTYEFDLLSGPYLTTYNTLNGPNPEDSVLTTPNYSHHFSDRWINDEMRITTGAATGVDILDRHKNLFGPGVCGRSEDTFSDGEGAFIVNKSGPVRALRSYIGANSGPLTVREHVFYESRQDIRTFLRVHAIPGVMDFFDYSPAASGMTYYNDLNTSGVTIDGSPDSVAQGAIQWELVTGAQGSLVMTASISTNIAGFAYTSYYLDDTTPGDTQCTGDAYAYGSSGVWIAQSIPCTDPSQGCSYYLRSSRSIYYKEPGLTIGDAEGLADRANDPLTYTVGPFKPPDGDTDGDTIPNSSDPDDDNDGCTDAQELGPSEALGGLRDPHDFWDVYDVWTRPVGNPSGWERNASIDLFGDIFGVAGRFGANDDGGSAPVNRNNDPLVEPPDETGYHPAFDRGPVVGPNPWNIGPPDGAVDLFIDIFGVANQFGHSCKAAP